MAVKRLRMIINITTMRRDVIIFLVILIMLGLCSCAAAQSSEIVSDGGTLAGTETEVVQTEDEGQSMIETYNTGTRISDVINDPVFGDYGRLIFPVDSGYMSGSTLGDLRLTWYNYIDPDKTVEICNYLRNHAENGDTVFYDIYTNEEKAADPDKADTGLFFLWIFLQRNGYGFTGSKEYECRIEGLLNKAVVYWLAYPY